MDYTKFLDETNRNELNSLFETLYGKELIDFWENLCLLTENKTVDFETIKKALNSFSGVYRRFETKYDDKILVIDDYAHHPTETTATLLGVRSGWKRRLIAVFQPHLFSRTRDFYAEFGRSFLNSDVFICTDVYPARENPIEGITGKLIADAAKNFGHKNVIYQEDKNKVPELLQTLVKDDDIIITMGAGDIWKYGEMFVSEYKALRNS